MSSPIDTPRDTASSAGKSAHPTIRSPLNEHSASPRREQRPSRALESLPEAVVNLLRESGWITLVTIGVFVLLALASFNASDPTWWQSNGNAVTNWGGLVGANLSAGLLALFGYSAWLGVAILVYETRRVHGTNKSSEDGRQPAAEAHRAFWERHAASCIHSSGVALFFLASIGLEHMAEVLSGRAPAAGQWNLLGEGLASALMTLFGNVGAVMILVVGLMVGLSVLLQLSWLNVARFLGAQLEQFVNFVDELRAPQPLHQSAESEVPARMTESDDSHTLSPHRAEPHLPPMDAGDFSSEPPEQSLVDLDDIMPPTAAVSDAESDAQHHEESEAIAAVPVQPVPAPTPAAENQPVESAQHRPTRPTDDMAIKPAPAAARAVVARRDALAPMELPSVELLDVPVGGSPVVSLEALERNSRLIEAKLKDFGVQATVVGSHAGPVVTRYEIDPAVGVKGSQIINLSRDLARSLSLTSLRVVDVIPGKNTMGLELPNPRKEIVRLSEIVGSEQYTKSASMLTVALGKDIAGQPVVADLAKMPHLLVAGTTGSGKSVGINATIISLLYRSSPQDVRLILIDPKMLEMSVYEGIPHLLTPVVTDMRLAANALNWSVGEMERRYKLMSKLGVRNLQGFNQKIADARAEGIELPNPFSTDPSDPEPLEKLPNIVIIIDELADLMMVAGKKVEELIARIAQKARAAGIHLVLATQRPSVDVITGLIKANVPTRIAFQVSSKVDSRTILDQMGAESLLGNGDMLYMPAGTGFPVRVHGAFVSDDEVHRVVDFLKQQGEPEYIDAILDGGEMSGSGAEGASGAEIEADDLYPQAVEVVLKNRRASISLVQRHLRIGYNRAARLLEQMEQNGVVSPMTSNGNRDILASSPDPAI